MGSLLEHSYRFGIVAVYLRTFKYLQTDGVIGIVSIERTATGLATVPYHSANTHRTVELFEQVGCQFIVVQLVDVLAAAVQIVLQEVLHTLQVGWRIVGSLQFSNVFESLFLQRYQYACYYLLPRYGFRFQSVGRYVVDILNEYHVGIYVVKILNERTVPTRTEQKRAVVVAERRVVGVCCYGIGAWFLLRESNGEAGAVVFLVHRLLLGSFCLEKFEVFVRYREVNVRLCTARCVLGSLNKVFFHCRAFAFGILVE